MNTTCTLQPFPGSHPSTDLRLTATASRQENIYAIQYSLVGRLSELAIPAPAPISLRQNTTPRPGAINPAEAAVSLDEFVTQIEQRLLETVREIVEARLPEIVQRVIREEIERLKSDAGPGA